MIRQRELLRLRNDIAQGPGRAAKQRPLLTLFYVIAFLGFLCIAFYRFFYGLGVTGINDAAPWGIWTALKLTLVVWSVCAFFLTAMVYIFKFEKFRPLVRPAALMGLLGYSSFALILIFELGWPWRIVHPIWMHNYTSILFEISWCVMLYLTFLVLEFLPNIFERLQMPRICNVTKKQLPSWS